MNEIKRLAKKSSEIDVVGVIREVNAYGETFKARIKRFKRKFFFEGI